MCNPELSHCKSDEWGDPIDLTEFNFVASKVLGLPPKILATSDRAATIAFPHAPEKLALGVLTLSSCLQRYAERRFLQVSIRLLNIPDYSVELYESTFNRWGNPSAENIERLFLRLAIHGIFDSKKEHSIDGELRIFLTEINQMRNKIAHGKSAADVFSSTQLEYALLEEWRVNALEFSKLFDFFLSSEIRARSI